LAGEIPSLAVVRIQELDNSLTTETPSQPVIPVLGDTKVSRRQPDAGPRWGAEFEMKVDQRLDEG